MRLSTLFGFVFLIVKVRTDPNPFHYPKNVLDRIIERAIEAEVNSQFPDDDAKYRNDEGGLFKQEIAQFKKVESNEYDDSPNSAKKVNQNSQQDQNQRAIPQEIIRKKFLENFFDVERVPEEVIKKSKKVLTKLQEPGSESGYHTGDDYSGDVYSTYREYPDDSHTKTSEQLKNEEEHPYDSYDKKSEHLKNEDEYPYVSYNKESEQLKNDDEYPYVSYNKESEQLKSENEYPYDSYYKEFGEQKKSEEDKEQVENKKPKESFFVNEYSSGYNQEWNGKEADKNYVPDKKEI